MKVKNDSYVLLRMMKKILTSLLAAAFLLTFTVGCGEEKKPTPAPRKGQEGCSQEGRAQEGERRRKSLRRKTRRKTRRKRLRRKTRVIGFLLALLRLQSGAF
ncbi:MAG UNVERIFIED_CONTAM: hypothetical protein LVR29_10765 [Microcystis novacekii LVE1205-3]|jgi:predicted small lipoprotein YifL